MLDQAALQQLSRQAIEAAVLAGKHIYQALNGSWTVERKADKDSLAAQVVTEVDREAQAIIIQKLALLTETYQLAILAEESTDNHERHHKAAFWCIDPLDGTLAFIRREPGFHVSIALVKQDGTPLLGVIYDPMQQKLYHSVNKTGCFYDQQPCSALPLHPQKPLTMLCDTGFASHPWYAETQTALQTLAGQLGLPGAQIKLQIGAVNNACEVLHKHNTVYFKYARTGESGGSLWDYAATASLFREAGAIACDIDGQAMELNRMGSTYMNHRGIIYAAQSEIAKAIINMAAEISSRHQNH